MFATCVYYCIVILILNYILCYCCIRRLENLLDLFHLFLWIRHSTLYVDMVNKCCAYGCKNGYVGHTPPETRITFHSFPADEKLREKCR